MIILLKNKYTLQIEDFFFKCVIGKNGTTKRKKEGDKKTPKGIYKIEHLYYRRDRIKKIKTKLKKIIIKKNMGWCDDSSSKNYNKLIRLPVKYNHEKLYKNDNSYDIILVLNFNMHPIKKNKGSAIFIHVAKKNYKKTLGCIAISKISLLKIIKKLNKKSIVEISNQR